MALAEVSQRPVEGCQQEDTVRPPPLEVSWKGLYSTGQPWPEWEHTLRSFDSRGSINQ